MVVYNTYMALLIKTGDNKVLESGSVISFGDNEVELELDFFKTTPATFLVFSFNADTKNTGTSMETAITESNKKLEVKLYNFESSLDAGNSEPMEIGLLDNKKVFLSFRVRKIGPSRTIDYTFYQNV